MVLKGKDPHVSKNWRGEGQFVQGEGGRVNDLSKEAVNFMLVTVNFFFFRNILNFAFIFDLSFLCLELNQ